MKTTNKALRKLTPLFQDIKFLVDYIEGHPETGKTKDSLVFEKFKRHALKAHFDMLNDDLM